MDAAIRGTASPPGRAARLPLASTIAAARAAQTGFPLGAVAAELAEAGGRLDAPSWQDSPQVASRHRIPAAVPSSGDDAGREQPPGQGGYQEAVPREG